MKLTIELVPSTSWGNNLRSVLKKEQWNKVRRDIYERANHRCEICGGKGSKHPVECHEIWEYDDIHKIQKLTGLIALCPNCHEVKHIGRAQVTGNYDRALSHLAKINSLTMRHS